MLLGSSAFGQTVQPVISEYQMKADGKFALTNGTLTPMVVVLEPKSFSITPDGQGCSVRSTTTFMSNCQP
jgi:hypothetical protein